MLNEQKIREYLPEIDRSSELTLHLFERLPSTNRKVWELLAAGGQIPLGSIAVEQTAGRGQWGRQWQSQRGGLYLSLALAPNFSVKNAPHLTLLSAWGITRALRQQGIPVLIKWPNDLILDGRKLGGILTETRIQQEQINLAVIGTGINWLNPVPEMGINLQSYPQITSLEQLAAVTIGGILFAYQEYLAQGIDKILPFYTELLYSRGKPVWINGTQGTIEGVTSQGELQVRLYAKGASTEVLFPPGAISLGYD